LACCHIDAPTCHTGVGGTLAQGIGAANNLGDAYVSEGVAQGVGSGGDDGTQTRAQLAARMGDVGVRFQGIQVEADGVHKTEIRIVERPTPRQHLVVWLVGVVLASLVPFLFLYFHGIDRGGPPSIFELLSRGDLLLISLVVTIAGITELVLVLNRIRQDQIMPVALVLLGGVLVVVAEAFWYADLSAQLLDGQKATSSHAVAFGSLLLFSLSAFCSSVSVTLSAGAR
jgi:hypothetical protein